jgi:hypothetical protein
VSSVPQWIELSGLPRLLNAECGSSAWLILRTLIDLDCALHSKPGTVALSIEELANRTGLEAAPTRKIVKQLNKGKWLTMFLPEHVEETAFFKIAEPLATPASHGDVLTSNPTLTVHRYCDCPQASANDDPDDAVLQEVVDFYLGQIAPTMNTFTIQKLRDLVALAPIADIRRAFKHAEYNEVRNLAFIIRRCLDYKKQRQPKEPVA